MNDNICFYSIDKQDFMFFLYFVFFYFREKQSSSSNHREKESLQTNVRHLVYVYKKKKK
jgi:hypothetical protein